MQYPVHWKISNQTKRNIRLSDHRKDVKSPNAIPPWKSFNQEYDFNNKAKSTLIETLNLKNFSTESKIETLKERENFWINSSGREDTSIKITLLRNFKNIFYVKYILSKSLNFKFKVNSLERHPAETTSR